MRAAAGIIAAFTAAVACGRVLGSDEDSPAPSAPSATDAGVTDTSDAGPADATTSPSFCATRTGWLACEDFALGLPPSRGFHAFGAGPPLVDDGAGAGRISLPAMDASAVSELAAEVDGGASTYRLDVTAKVSGDEGAIAVARLLVIAPDTTSLGAAVFARPAMSASVCFFKPGSGQCDPDSISVSFAAATPISIVIGVDGSIAVTVGAGTRSRLFAAIPSAASTKAEVGAVTAEPGSARVVTLDDAILGVQ